MLEKDHIFDKRITERNILRGRLTRSKLNDHMKSLPNEAHKADEITVEVREGEFRVDFPEPREE